MHISDKKCSDEFSPHNSSSFADSPPQVQMAFPARWRELTKLGWKSSKPSGLSNDYTYIMPGKRKRGGVRGQDYFIGEEELMKFLDRMDLGKKKRVYHVLGFSTDIVCLALTELARNRTSTMQVGSPSPSPLKPASAQPHAKERTMIVQAKPHQSEGEDKSNAARPDEATQPVAASQNDGRITEGVHTGFGSILTCICSSSDNDSDSSGIAAPGAAIGEEQPRAQDIDEMKEDSPIADPGLANLYTHDK
ncbi:unnamed protein product [Phytophthora fragariaefolia]|uniref:Unnamed protein product n=1 Tax=Phytophthora fragariaefolia TaxID=1490495 RepID=A0A9W6XK65_9STRA|nr:unnamed protein product [Phytophthora fragariaefolia]